MEYMKDLTDLLIKRERNYQLLSEEMAKLRAHLAKMGHGCEMDACELWRIKGDEAYKEGDMVKAEEYYTTGVNCISEKTLSGRSCCDPLVLCYSKRADTRKRQEKIRDALNDCESAAEIDPQFLGIHITAANCHLLLGEVGDAMSCFNKLGKSGDSVCLDRRITLEAAEGLEKAKKVENVIRLFWRVEEYTNSIEKCRKIDYAAQNLDVIEEALAISSFSEKLLELKGNVLLMLQKYEDVIELCEKTLDFAEKNFPIVDLEVDSPGCHSEKQTDSSVNLWRWHLMSKAYFHLGRIERTLDLLLKQRDISRLADASIDIRYFTSRCRGILYHQNAGKEAFHANSYEKSVEHYTDALSISTGSGPVIASCFYNRAAALLQLGRIYDSIADCNVAIALYGDYKEALSLRADTFLTVRACHHGANDLTKLISALDKESRESVELSSVYDPLACSDMDEWRAACSEFLSAERMSKLRKPVLDAYLLLGVKISDTAGVIRRAYREAANRHCPDKVVGKFLADTGEDSQLWNDIADEVLENAGILFQMITKAYEAISNTNKRSMYDFHEEKMKAKENDRSESTNRKETPMLPEFKLRLLKKRWLI